VHAFAWAPLAATTFAAGLLQAASGFGFAALAAPLFLFFLDPASAIQLVLVLTAALSIFVLPGVWRATDRGLLWRLVLGSLAGLPFGLLAFRWADPIVLRVAVVAVILGIAALLASLPRRRGSTLFVTNRGLDCAAGAVSGAMTALFGISGPPIVIYLLLAGVSPARLRATLLSYFSICYTATILCHAIGVGIAPAIWSMAGILIPFACAGGILGKRLGDRLGPRAFAALAIALLATTASYQLAASVASLLSPKAGHSAADR
jgi:uncharacterized membrane protein YfcA